MSQLNWLFLCLPVLLILSIGPLCAAMSALIDKRISIFFMKCYVASVLNHSKVLMSKVKRANFFM